MRAKHPQYTGGGGATSAKSLNSGLSSQALGSQALNNELSSPLSNGKALNSTLLASNLTPKAAQTPHSELLALNSATQNPHSTLLAQNGVQNPTAQTPPPPPPAEQPGFFGRVLGVGGGDPKNYEIPTYELGAVEITAPQEVDYNPTAEVVGRAEMDNSASLDAGQALRFKQGMFYVPNAKGPAKIYIRGFNSRDIGIYLDGIPVNDIYIGNAAADTDLLPYFSFGLSEVQVSKGYTSPVFSVGKMGGAINMVSTIPAKNLEFNLGYRFIANNEHRTNVQLGRNLGNQYFQVTFSHINRKSLNYSYSHPAFTSSFSTTTGRYTYTPIEQGPTEIPLTYRYGYMFSGKYGWLNEDHHYSLNFYHQHEKMQGSQPSTPFNFPYYDKSALYLLGDSKFTDLVSLNSKIWYHMNTNVGFFRSNGNGSRYDDYSVGLTETVKLDFSKDQNLKVGLMMKNDNHKAYDNDDTSPAAYAANGQDFAKRDYKLLNSSLFAEYAMRLNDTFRFALSGSWDRHDGLRVRNGDTVNGIWDSPKKHLNGWSLQGILYVQPVESLLLHANVGHKTQIPKVRYIYGDGVAIQQNTDISPESLINYELGFDFEYASTKIGAAAYYHDINSMIYSVNLPSSDTTQCRTNNSRISGLSCVQYKNASEGYSWGGEFYAKQGLFDDILTLSANYSYIIRKSYIRTNGVKTATAEFVTQPRHSINLGARLAPAKEYDINVMGSVQTSHRSYSARYVQSGGTWATVYDLVTLPTVVFFDVEANYYVTNRLKFTIGAYNIMDKDYSYQYSHGDGGTPISSVGHAGISEAASLPGRRIFAGVEYRY